MQRKCQPKAQPLLGGSLSLYVRRFRSFIINIHMYTHKDTHTHIYNMRNAGISYDKVEFKVYELDGRRRTETTHSQHCLSHLPHAL